MTIDSRDQNYLKKLTVLYVEDDEETRDQFREFLSRPVGTLLTAANGVEGLELFKKNIPDIVVTDILMPQMDGLTMSYEIRGISPSVPIIVVTAFEETDYLKRAIDIGVDKYVTKPVNSYMLFECLLECAHRLRAEDQLKFEQQRKIQEMWAKHREIVATLAGGMAHDYNNLLQVILGYMSVAREKLAAHNENPDFLNNVDDFYSQSVALGSRLNILSNSDDECMEQNDVMSLIRRSIEQSLINTPISFSCDYPDDLPPVSFFKQHMHMVFSDIAHNAVEAMPSGGKLHLAAQKAAVTESDNLTLIPGDYLHIQLTDTGVGIAPEILPNIFSPYFSSKQKCSQRCTGLSLALCHTIIMKHGGIITAESSQGNGATFHIWLPIPVQ